MMSDVFIADLLYFQINKYITIFCCIESTFYRYARIYQAHDMGYNTLYMYFTYTTKNNLHHFSILFYISIF